LKIGDTEASFQVDGSADFENEQEKRWCRGFAKVSALAFKTLQPIPSGPGEDESFSRCNSSLMAEIGKSISWRAFLLREPAGIGIMVCAVSFT
jgi:hypothetical protein